MRSMSKIRAMLEEATKDPALLAHAAKKKELEGKISEHRAAWEGAQHDLRKHMEDHPNYAKNKAKRDATAAKRPRHDGYEEGRSTPRKNGNW